MTNKNVTEIDDIFGMHFKILRIVANYYLLKHVTAIATKIFLLYQFCTC